ASPAYVIGRRTDVLAWNYAAARVLLDLERLAPEERNLLRLVFLEPQMRSRLVDWETSARHVVAQFRASAGPLVAHASFAELIEDIAGKSPALRRLWAAHEVGADFAGNKQIRHPELGTLDFDFTTFAVTSAPGVTLHLYTPLASGAAKLRRWLAKP